MPALFRIALGSAALPLLADAATGQELVIPDVSYPPLPAAAANAEGFAPSGWRVETMASGDLNGDGAADLAFVLRMQDPANILVHDGFGNNPFDTNPRILAVAFAAAGRTGYRLAVENRVLISRRTNPSQEDHFGDFSDGIRAAGGTLRVSLHRFMNAGGWDAGPMHFTFRWQDNALRLIGYDYANVQRNSGCHTSLSINYLTRRVRTSLGRNDSDAEQVRWTRLPARPLLTIDGVGDGLEFDAHGAIGRLGDCPRGD